MLIASLDPLFEIFGLNYPFEPLTTSFALFLLRLSSTKVFARLTHSFLSKSFRIEAAPFWFKIS